MIEKEEPVGKKLEKIPPSMHELERFGLNNDSLAGLVNRLKAITEKLVGLEEEKDRPTRELLEKSGFVFIESLCRKNNEYENNLDNLVCLITRLENF